MRPAPCLQVFGSCWRPGCPALYSASVVDGAHVHHQLQQAQTVRSCEHDTVSLLCARGRIDIIGASYGRQHDGVVCPHEATSAQECHAPESVSIVRNACQDQPSCEIEASNGIFGDPCGGTFKYLTVNYQCV